MHRMVKRAAVLGVLVMLAMSVEPAASQGSPPADNLPFVTAVLRFRLNWLEDRTPFDGCSLSARVGRPADVVRSEVPPELRDLVGAEGEDCRTSAAAARIVQVHSITLQNDTVARVQLFVRKGEHSHIEDYALRRTPLGGWDVAEMRLWGRVYALPPRPRQ